MQWGDLYNRPKPQASLRVAYGPLPQQFADLWLPEGLGPHPVVVMIHGGCWTKAIATLEIMNWAAEDLRRRGLAVWNIEYRGVDEPSGGYPGAYHDVASAIDALETARAPDRAIPELDLGRIIALGHSAGGHLALWAGGRRKIPVESPLYAARPTPIAAVVNLAGLADLERNLDTACGPDPVAAMVGAPTAERPDPYLDTSPAAMLPLGVPQYVIYGVDDETVRPEIGDAYASAAAAAGDRVALRHPPGGHVEAIAPGTAAWEATAALIETLVR